MFKDVIIGQYIEGNSPIHKMDAKMKIILTFLFMILLFSVNKAVSYGLIGIFTFLFVLMCGVPFKFILKGLKPMLYILVFTALMNLFFTKGDPIFSIPIFGWFNLSISYQGLRTAILMVVRLLMLLIGTSVLTLTTTPLQLTDGIERLLRPLKKIKVPAHEIAMMMTIAIRFIPTLADETDKIMKAQMARGADFESGNLITRAKAMIPILIPLFVSAFRRADDLATAMEARCYNGDNGRTRMNEMHIKKSDYMALLIFLVFSAAVIFFEFIF